MVDIKLLSKDINFKIFSEELDVNHRRIYISEFPWKMIADNVHKMSSYDSVEFSLISLINMYILIVNGGSGIFNRAESYIREEYYKYKDVIPPMKFDINKDDLYNLLYKYYDSHGYTNRGCRAEKDCDYILKYDRLPEILFQCHKYTEGRNRVMADYLITVERRSDNKHLLYEEDTNIKDLLKLKSEDKLRLLGIEL